MFLEVILIFSLALAGTYVYQKAATKTDQQIYLSCMKDCKSKVATESCQNKCKDVFYDK
jgi:hypothetical protein